MIKKALTCFAFLAASSSIAFADNVTTTGLYGTYTNIDSSYSQGVWNGVYFGVGGGYALGQTDTNTSLIVGGQTAGTPSLTNDLSAAQVVGILGYGHAFEQWYFAGQVDAGSFLGSNNDTTTSTNGSFSLTQKPTWSVTPSGILGYLFTPNWLAYARVGIPLMGMQGTGTVISTGATTQDDNFNFGLLGGLGVSYSLARHVKLNLEDDVTHIWGAQDTWNYVKHGGPGASENTATQSTFNTVMMSVTFNF